MTKPNGMENVRDAAHLIELSKAKKSVWWISKPIPASVVLNMRFCDVMRGIERGLPVYEKKGGGNEH